MTEELKVVLRRSEHSGFGFSLLGTTGPPHVIYDIIENSPAADCAVEAGDIILKVNGTDVHRYTTKEVLKCLRLSDDVVTLELRRDPKLKARIKEQLANTRSPHYVDIESQNNYDYRKSSSHHTSPTSPRPHHHATALQDHNIHYDTHISNSSNSNLNATPGGSSSLGAICLKSPTHLPPSSHRQATTTTTTTSSSSANHSRSSSGSSAKIQISVETNSAGGSGAAAVSTSPTCRPSRIPTAMKCPQKPPVQHSPQHKRPRPSQIPTKASSVSANGSAPTACQTGSSVAHLQHSNSYSGGSGNSRFQQQQYHNQQTVQDPEPISAPPQPSKAPRFEAYMMTGDLILNLSRTPQSSNLIPAHAKKIDSLRDSPNRTAAANTARPNGALAPRASGESSPTSSSSVESPTHTASSDSVDLQQKQQKGKSKRRHQQHQHQLLQQHKRDSINNSYNNSNSGGGDDHRHYSRKDSLTNDTLLLCEELKRDEEADVVGDDDHDFDEEDNDDLNEEENEEDQTHYDITNIETYNSGGIGGGGGERNEASDHQRLVMNYDEDDEDASGIAAGDEEEDDYSVNNSLGSASAKQRLRALKQKTSIAGSAAAAATSTRYNKGIRSGGDLVDCPPTSRHRHYYTAHHGSGSSSSSATVRSDDGLGGGGINTSSPDETSFSVPTSPISLSTPLLIDKETANSVPTSPEPSSLGAGAVGCIGVHDSVSGGGIGVVRRHNGVVRTCDSAGFRTSKSEDHLQQIQREGIGAVIPIDIDEDVNSSLNTLLDTRHDSEDSQGSNHDRIVWTYNAPLPPHQQQQLQHHYNQYPSHYGGGGGGASQNSQSPNSHSHSHSSSISSSPQHSAGSPASPTSVSSSVMSSSGSKGALGISGNYAASNNNGHNQQQQQQLKNTNDGTLTTNTATGTGTATGTTATAITMGLLQCPINNGSGSGGGGGSGGGSNSVVAGDHSVSEAISNISSPDYQDDDNLLSSRDLVGGMILSDPSDSDSTILVSDAAVQRQQQQQQQMQKSQQSEHKLVIQVRGIDSSNSASPRSAYSELKDSEDELATLTEEHPTALLANSGGSGSDARESSPPVSDDGSDVESLHSYHYSPKAVDMPSAIRLAKRLYSLDGFKKSDVSRHLSKNNDFSRAVADEYLKYFYFEKKTLDQSLREFLQQFSLSGETQERERVLVHFSKRFLDCNPGTFNSQDAVHTLTCAIMLLNTDLHGQNTGRKMTCAEFVENLTELNDGENFPKDVLKYLYQAIKTQPLEWALDDDAAELQKQRNDNNVSSGAASHVGQNPFLDIPESSTAIEYKKGYVMRKCCYDSNYKKTPFGKRSWKMFYCTLRDLVLFLHKDEHGFRKSQMSDNLHNAIRIHHALATKAADYTKKQHVFRLQTADQAEYLFQTSDSKELTSWVETINFVCAAYSAPPLEGGVGSQKRFQRPLLPSTHTKLLMKEQLESHDQQLAQLENVLLEHRKGPIPSKGLPLQNYKEKENYLQYELRRYKTYVSILSAKLLADQQQIDMLQLTNNEESDTFPIASVAVAVAAGVRQQQQQQQQQPQPQSTNSALEEELRSPSMGRKGGGAA